MLNISHGKIFVHLNPKLCPHRIDHLKSYAYVSDWDEKDVSRHSNGDKEACNLQKLDVIVKKIRAFGVMVLIQNFAKKMDDARSLLSYLISYREVESGNITMFDGRDGCSNDWHTIEESTNALFKDDYKEVLLSVKPATRYALYVRTFTILSQDNGALSDIIYFRTAPHSKYRIKTTIQKPLK